MRHHLTPLFASSRQCKALLLGGCSLLALAVVASPAEARRQLVPDQPSIEVNLSVLRELQRSAPQPVPFAMKPAKPPVEIAKAPTPPAPPPVIAPPPALPPMAAQRQAPMQNPAMHNSVAPPAPVVAPPAPVIAKAPPPPPPPPAPVITQSFGALVPVEPQSNIPADAGANFATFKPDYRSRDAANPPPPKPPVKHSTAAPKPTAEQQKRAQEKATPRYLDTAAAAAIAPEPETARNKVLSRLGPSPKPKPLKDAPAANEPPVGGMALQPGKAPEFANEEGVILPDPGFIPEPEKPAITPEPAAPAAKSADDAPALPEPTLDDKQFSDFPDMPELPPMTDESPAPQPEAAAPSFDDLPDEAPAAPAAKNEPPLLPVPDPFASVNEKLDKQAATAPAPELPPMADMPDLPALPEPAITEKAPEMPAPDMPAPQMPELPAMDALEAPTEKAAEDKPAMPELPPMNEMPDMPELPPAPDLTPAKDSALPPVPEPEALGDAGAAAAKTDLPEFPDMPDMPEMPAPEMPAASTPALPDPDLLSGSAAPAPVGDVSAPLPSLSALTGEKAPAEMPEVESFTAPEAAKPAPVPAPPAEPNQQELAALPPAPTMPDLPVPSAADAPRSKSAYTASIPFAATDSEVPESERSRLKALAAKLVENEQGVTIRPVISANTELTPTVQAIATRRAFDVRTFLIDEGVNHLYITVDGLEAEADATGERVDLIIE